MNYLKSMHDTTQIPKAIEEYSHSHLHSKQHTKTLMPTPILTLAFVLRHLRVPKVGVRFSFSQLNRSQRSSGKFINDKLLMRKMDNADEDVDTDDAPSPTGRGGSSAPTIQ